MVATANAVNLAGGKVIFCNISKDNLCIEPNKLKKKLTKKLKL